jgi:hypothetical protein
MAIPPPSFYSQPPTHYGPVPQPPLQLQAPPQAGTVYMRDDFLPDPQAGVPHGDVVGYTGRKQGFNGHLEGHQQPQNSNWGQFSSIESFNSLNTDKLCREDALNSISKAAEGMASGMMDSQSSYLDQMAAKGVKNSVVNLSWGSSKARVSSNLYEDAAKAWLPGDSNDGPPDQAALNNFATAFNLDTAKLHSTDPKVHGPERQKLQQGLINQVSTAIDESSAVGCSKKNWERAVNGFEGQKNSVVIAAGNQGELHDAFEKSNHGRQVEVPKDFETSFLQTDEVTSVGATRWFQKDGQLKERQAKYSSQTDGIDIYASGSVRAPKNPDKAIEWGTSYAAPRVSVAMGELHRQNPDLSSAEVERLMKNKFTHNTNTASGQVKVLDYGKTFNFLQNSTY